MKNKLKSSTIFTLLVLFTLFFTLFVSCSKDAGTVTESGETETEGEAAAEVITLAKGGNAEYTIVRGEGADKTEINAAVTLNQALNDMGYGKFSITTDWIKPGEEENVKTAKEILVGKTDRDESKAALSSVASGSYIIESIGNKIVILGDSSLGTEKAVDDIISGKVGLFIEEKDAATLSLPSELKYSGTYDSILPHTIVNYSTSVATAIGGSEQDAIRLTTCLQGLINRDFAETDMLVHQTMDSTDTFWLNYMTEDGNFFADYKIYDITSADEYLTYFLTFIKKYGIVAWDSEVPATANVASTICGVDSYLPVMYSEDENSLYQKLISLGVEEKMSLVGKFTGSGTIPDTNIESSGSAKCDAYLWALEMYMDKCSTEVMGYVLDGAGCIPGTTTYEGAESTNAFYNQIYNHDYFVMKKAFCFDLTSNAKEAPFDDPTQPVGTDYETLCKILQAAYDRADGEFTQIVGFPPWWMKYTRFLSRGNIGEVDLEWQFAQLVSTYNCALEADCAHPCCMTNASLYTYYPLADSYENNKPAETIEYDKQVRYFTIYIGDYDSSAWLKSVIPGFWKDEARGTVPLTWGLNPNLSNRIPMVFDYVYKNKSDLDYFVTGDSGAGYVNPSALVLNRRRYRTLPDATATWVEYNAPYLARFNMDICGFILNGAMNYCTEVYDMYSKITPVGAFSNSSEKLTLYNGTPILSMTDYQTPEQSFYYMKNKINFSVFRTIRKSPSEVKDIAMQIEEYCNNRDTRFTYKYVGPYELFDLIKQSGLGRVVDPLG